MITDFNVLNNSIKDSINAIDQVDMTCINQVTDFAHIHRKHDREALLVTLACIEAMLTLQSWGEMALLLSDVNDRLKNRILDIINATTTGLTVIEDTSFKYVNFRFVMEDDFGPTEKMDAFRHLVEEGETLFSSRVNQLIY